MNTYQVKPKRSIQFRDITWAIYYFFWLHTRIIRRIWCKHNGVHTSGTSTNWVTICSNCGSSDVPQCAGMQQKVAK